ncbi:hypothetical protein RBB50_006739 [Rhinocladiella similis]
MDGQTLPTGDPKAQRSACERCRSHKLKCIRTPLDGHHERCDRCAKAGVQCQTFPSLPPGRPRLDADHGRQSSRQLDKKRKAAQQACKNSYLGSQGGSSSHLPSQENPLRHAAPPAESFTTGESTIQPPFRSDVPEYALDNIQSATTSSYDAVDLNDDHNTGFDDFMTFPGLDGWSDLGQFTQLLGATLPTASQVDKRYHYLGKLTDLNAELLKYTLNVDNTTTSSTETSRPLASVGQMLSFVQRFLEVLKYYLVTFSIKSAPRFAKDSNTKTDDDDDSEPEFGSGEEELRIRTRSSEAGGNQSSTSEASGSSEERSGLDYPTALALGTGYVSLVRLYRVWLQAMMGRLEKSAHRVREYAVARNSAATGEHDPRHPTTNHLAYSQLFNDIPQVLPGVYLDGFDLGDYRSLQISVFMQVSMDLLWRAERGVAALVATDSVGPNVSSGTLPLLQAMLQQEVRTATSTHAPNQVDKRAGPEEIGLQSLKVLVRTIRKGLRSNVCLQLEEGNRSAETWNLT